MNSEANGIVWTVVIVIIVIFAVCLAYRSHPEWFADSVAILTSPTPGEVHRLRALEKRVNDVEAKLAEQEHGGSVETKVRSGVAGMGEYILPLVDSTGGVTELHIPVHTGGVTLLEGFTR